MGRESVRTPRHSHYSYLGGRVLGGVVREARDKALSNFGVALFGVASFSGVARDKALAKVGSHPDLFLCGFWLKKKSAVSLPRYLRTMYLLRIVRHFILHDPTGL